MATTITVSVSGSTATASGKSGAQPTTYIAEIKNKAGTVVFQDTKSIPDNTDFSFSTHLSDGDYTLRVTGTDGTSTIALFTLPAD